MKQRTLFHNTATAFILGLVANLLLQNAETGGVNLVILFWILAGGAFWTLSKSGSEARAWIGGALMLVTVTFLLRDAPVLHLTAFLGAAAAFAFAALRAGEDWIHEGRVAAPVEAVAGSVFHTVLGPIPHLSGPIVRGAVLAAPLVLLFGALLAEADPVFARQMHDLMGTIVPSAVVDHLIGTLFLTWLASGYLGGLGRGTAFVHRLYLPRVRLGATEVNLATGVVSLLFLAFVAVQLQVLIAGTTELSHAEYAREGFFQLVLAIALITPLLLGGAWLVDRDAAAPGPGASNQKRSNGLWTGARVFRILGGLQVTLLLIMAASALVRVRLYQAAFGTTEARLYAAIFLGWLMFVGVWFGFTILMKGKRSTFLPATLISAYAVIATLVIASPDAMVARDQLARGDAMDVAYVASLSADAMPTLVRALPELSPEVQAALTDAWFKRWGPAGPPARNWHNWNGAEARGRAAYLDMVRAQWP